MSSYYAKSSYFKRSHSFHDGTTDSDAAASRYRPSQARARPPFSARSSYSNFDTAMTSQGSLERQRSFSGVTPQRSLERQRSFSGVTPQGSLERQRSFTGLMPSASRTQSQSGYSSTTSSTQKPRPFTRMHSDGMLLMTSNTTGSALWSSNGSSSVPASPRSADVTSMLSYSTETNVLSAQAQRKYNSYLPTGTSKFYSSQYPSRY